MSMPRPTHRLPVVGPHSLAAAAVALVLIAGCGSATEQSGSSPSPEPTGTTSEDAATSEESGTSDASDASGTSDDSETPEDSDTETITEGPIVIEPLPDDSDKTGGRIEPVLPTGAVPTEVQERPEVQAAIADLARRTKVDQAAVSVAGYAEVTWSDGSIGCPEPGTMYTQALIPGHQLILQSDGRLFSYHAAQGKDFGYCADPVAPTQADSTM